MVSSIPEAEGWCLMRASDIRRLDINSHLLLTIQCEGKMCLNNLGTIDPLVWNTFKEKINVIGPKLKDHLFCEQGGDLGAERSRRLHRTWMWRLMWRSFVEDA